jgi:6-phosphofructokinase 1
LGRCVIAASEGIRDEKSGKYLAEVGGKFAQDSFGHAQLGGAGDAVASYVENKIGVKCRRARPGTAQREAMHFASLTDVNEAYMVGQRAVQHAAEGTSGYMVTLVREGSSPYRSTTGLAKLSEIANGEKPVPREWINAEGNHITEKLREYIVPLMQGQAPIEIGPDGLPVYMRFERHFLPKKCKSWQGQK